MSWDSEIGAKQNPNSDSFASSAFAQVDSINDSRAGFSRGKCTWDGYVVLVFAVAIVFVMVVPIVLILVFVMAAIAEVRLLKAEDFRTGEYRVNGNTDAGKLGPTFLQLTPYLHLLTDTSEALPYFHTSEAFFALPLLPESSVRRVYLDGT